MGAAFEKANAENTLGRMGSALDNIVRTAGDAALKMLGPIIERATAAAAGFAATTGQLWTAQALAQVTRDDAAITNLAIGVEQRDSGGGLLLSTADDYHASRLSWQRRSHSVTTSAGTTAHVLHRIFVTNSVPSGTTIDFEIRIGLPNIAQGLLSSPVLGGSGSTTRAADLLTHAWAGRSDAGTLIAAIQDAQPAVGAEVFRIDDGTANNLIAARWVTTTTIGVTAVVGGSSASTTLTVPYTTGALTAVVMAWGGGSVLLSANGSLPVNQALALPTAALNRVVLGENMNGRMLRAGRIIGAANTTEVRLWAQPSLWEH
jgi:hypothetical protein